MAVNNTNNQKSLATVSKGLEQSLLSTITTYAKEGKIRLSTSYSPENALKSAFLKIGELTNKAGVPALQCCTPASVSQAILDMMLQGLNPAKAQCYFIITGNRLTLFRSYLGTVKAMKEMNPDIASVNADVIHQGDTYRIVHTDNGMTSIEDHKTESLDALDAPIIGAYAKILDTDGKLLASCVMTRREIEAAWDQSTHKGWRDSPNDVHRKFPQEMAKKSVLSRACKLLLGTSDDTSLLSDAYQRTTENEYMRDVTPRQAEQRLGASALKAKLGKKEEPVQEQEEPVQEPEQEAAQAEGDQPKAEQPQQGPAVEPDEGDIPEEMTEDGEIPPEYADGEVF